MPVAVVLAFVCSLIRRRPNDAGRFGFDQSLEHELNARPDQFDVFAGAKRVKLCVGVKLLLDHPCDLLVVSFRIRRDSLRWSPRWWTLLAIYTSPWDVPGCRVGYADADFLPTAPLGVLPSRICISIFAEPVLTTQGSPQDSNVIASSRPARARPTARCWQVSTLRRTVSRTGTDPDSTESRSLDDAADVAVNRRTKHSGA